MDKKILITGSVFGVLAVLLGAFGAHGLEKLVDARGITSFTTGVRYQMYHALLLLFIGGTSHLTEKSKHTLYYFFLLGVILFSGSIYLLVIDEVFGLDFSQIALITPLGGFLLIVGWGLLTRDFFNAKS